MEKKFVDLEKNIGLKFKNKELLQQALVHRSYLNENRKFELGHNERLEFLGDAVLEILVTEFLYHKFSEKPEGELTNLRASLVNSQMLSRVSSELKLEKYIFLSKGEKKDVKSKSRQYILANAVESIIGAIYLDQGIKSAKKFVVKFMISKLDDILENELYLDPKSKFQEIAQEKTKITPNYKLIKASGPDHEKIFKIGLYLEEELISTGKGFSKHEAQMEAAKKGLKKKKWQ